MQIPVRPIPSILPPLATKHTTPRRIPRHPTNRPPQQRQSRRLIQPRPLALTRRKQLIQQWRVDHADNRVCVDAERNADAKHGEAVCEIHRAVERVHDPGWGVWGDEVGFLGRAGFRVGFFADEGVRRVGFADGGVDECFDFWGGRC